MGDPPKPRRTPGGALPPHLARPRAPEGNGHAPHTQPGLMPQAWERLDAEDEDQDRLAAERTAFRRVAEVFPDAEVRASSRPSRAAILGVLLIAGVVMLAIVLYRLAPP